MKSSKLSLETLQKRFLSQLIQHGVLRFGSFTTKSGRQSPYFVNTGLFNDGEKLGDLVAALADLVELKGLQFDGIFGPAYKGIPIAVALCLELQRRGKNVYYFFDRKEAKDHGDGGAFVGRLPEKNDKILIVDDVITSGLSLYESVDCLSPFSVDIAAALVSVDRQEKGQKSDRAASAEFSRERNIKVFSVINLDSILEKSRELKLIDDKIELEISKYRKQYGGKSL